MMNNSENSVSDNKIKELQEEIIKLKEQLENLRNLKDKEVRQAYLDVEEYYYIVSHELKTPIREIDLYAKFIEEDNADALTAESLEDLRSIQQTCDKVIEMIHHFMDYSKADKKILNREIIKMKPLVQDCFSYSIKTISGRQIDLEVSELPDIIGDKLLITQVINNILSNCIKFTQNISDGKIKIYSFEETDTINFCFEDNGAGFNMRYASGIFKIFERLHNETDYAGYGIGLATVKRIVDRFEGSVEIFGLVNKGCVVTVKLPKDMVITTEHTAKTNGKKKDKIIIGVIGTVTGDYAVITPCRKFAYELAVNEINASGGIAGKKIELIFKDFQSNAPLSAKLAWELIEIEKADVIMGGVLSSAREEIRKAADKTKTLYFYNSLYEGGVADHYTFCISAAPEQNLYPMLQYLTERYGKKCYIITADYSYGILSAENAKHYIEKLGGKIVGVEYFQVSKSNFNVTIENIKEANPDILLSFCVSKNQHSFHKQWYDKGIREIPVVASISIGESFLHKVYKPPTMNNIYFMCSYVEELKTPKAIEFTRKIHAKHPNDVVPYIEFDAEPAYTAVYLYKKAVELAGTTDTEHVIKALESGNVSFDGPGGMVTVRGEDHHVIRDMRLFRVNEKNNIMEIAEYPALHSDFIERIIEQETGIKGGLRKCGLNSPNMQYNLMFHRPM